MRLFFGTDCMGNSVEVKFDLINNGKINLERDCVTIWSEEIGWGVKKAFCCPPVADGVSICLGDDSKLAVVELDDAFADKDLCEDLRCVPVEFTPEEEAWLVEFW